MSRIGKQPIQIPEGVEVKQEASTIVVTGPKGNLQLNLLDGFSLEQADGQLTVKKTKENEMTQKQYGLQRSLLANMIQGVSEGFTKQLEINGVGFRAQMKGTTLEMSLGFSHPIHFEAPEGVDISVNQNIITVAGFDKQAVGPLH